MKFLCLFAIVLLSGVLSCGAAVQKRTFTLWQLPEQTYSQMMSYVIQTPNGRIVVIDGGMPGDAPYLRGFLAAQGNHVDVWFISHLHDDHMGAITDILNKPGDLKIGRIYSSMPDPNWTKAIASAGEQEAITRFEKALSAAGRTVIDLRLGQVMNIDGVKFQVLGIGNEDIRANPLNNSSVVLKVSDSIKSVLFLGDLGPEGGEKLMLGKYVRSLRADYVQMAHHGQNGVGLPVYKAIQPTHCLWPTPIWLWDNNINGKGKDSGPWKTLEVRRWIDDLNVKQNYVSADGLVRIE